MRTAFLAVAGAAAAGLAAGLDNGLAITPPMGWRSWNAMHGDVDDPKIRSTVDAGGDAVM